jgi:hypothetical protein
MANIQPADKWGINAEHLTVASYNRLLRVVAGTEPPSKGLESTTKYQFLLPYFVLGGMAGLRTCELVRSEPADPVLNWEDILWAKNLIVVRHEVAKQTRCRDHKRYVPLEREAAEILKPLAGKGPVIACCITTFISKGESSPAICESNFRRTVSGIRTRPTHSRSDQSVKSQKQWGTQSQL